MGIFMPTHGGKMDANTKKPDLLEDLKRISEHEQYPFEIEYDESQDSIIEISDSPTFFEGKCIFDHYSDEQASTILEAFVLNDIKPGYLLSCEFSKLLATRGNLVASIVEPIIRNTDWSTMNNNFFLLSYLPFMNEGTNLIIKMLNVVPEDFRDGLFLACYNINNREVDLALINKFIIWSKDDSWAPLSTGEHDALGCFLKKWLKNHEIFELEETIRIFFRFYEP